jgi:hypothetical protein
MPIVYLTGVLQTLSKETARAIQMILPPFQHAAGSVDLALKLGLRCCGKPLRLIQVPDGLDKAAEQNIRACSERLLFDGQIAIGQMGWQFGADQRQHFLAHSSLVHEDFRFKKAELPRPFFVAASEALVSLVRFTSGIQKVAANKRLSRVVERFLWIRWSAAPGPQQDQSQNADQRCNSMLS